MTALVWGSVNGRRPDSMICALGCRSNICFATADPTLPVPPIIKNVSGRDGENEDDDDGFGAAELVLVIENAWIPLT